MNTKTIVIYLAAVILILGGAYWLNSASGTSGPGKLDGFAQCLEDKGAVFYGAFWCSHCQNQKKLFGSSQQYLPYVECSTPNGTGQIQVCAEKGIQSYPTWVYPDGTRETGEISLARLSEKTGCALPDQTPAEAINQFASSTQNIASSSPAR